MSNLYGVRLLRETISIETMGVPVELKLSWSDGMVGAIPVFDNHEDALRYADGDKDRVFGLEKG